MDIGLVAIPALVIVFQGQAWTYPVAFMVVIFCFVWIVLGGIQFILKTILELSSVEDEDEDDDCGAISPAPAVAGGARYPAICGNATCNARLVM